MYIKKNWITGETIDAYELNSLEEGVYQNSEDLIEKYEKPSSGIPKTDLASAVQTSLEKADSAYQKHLAVFQKTDLASAVQTSLNKADNSVQQVSGKGLSTNDYDNAEKAAVALFKELGLSVIDGKIAQTI